MAKRDFLVSIDLNRNELLQAVLHHFPTVASLPDGSAPSPRAEGQLAYVEENNKPYYFDGTDWIDFYGGIEEISADGGLGFTSGAGTDAKVYLQVLTDDSSLEVSTGVDGVVRIKDGGVTEVKIADEAVTLAKLADIANLRVIGNTSGSSGTPHPVEIVTVIDGDDDTVIPTEGAVYDYVNSQITALGALVGDWDASGGTFPVWGVDGDPNPIAKGDYWYITVGGDMGSHHVTTGDVLYAKVATPGQTETNWFVVEANYKQATEEERGVAELATQTETDLGADDLRIVTPLKLKNWFLNQNVVKSAEFVITGNGTLTSFDLTHNFNTNYVQVEMLEATTGLTVEAQYDRTSADVLTVSFNTAPVASKVYNVSVMGSDNSM